jgi:signal transduction histidine kinase
VNTLVFQTGRAARIDDYASASGPPAEDALRIGLRAAVGVPVNVEGRLWGVMAVGSRAEPEIAAYYTVAEALTNAAKHASATGVQIEVAESNGVLHINTHDNGRGGAGFSHGSGLVGLRDRAEALGGHLQVHSPFREGTTLEVELPLHDPSWPPLPPEAADPAEQFKAF